MKELIEVVTKHFETNLYSLKCKLITCIINLMEKGAKLQDTIMLEETFTILWCDGCVEYCQDIEKFSIEKLDSGAWGYKYQYTLDDYIYQNELNSLEIQSLIAILKHLELKKK